MKDEIILLKSFLKKPNLEKPNSKAVFVGKTKDSILIGPYVDNKFNYDEFYKRIVSSCIYSKRIYKRISKKKAKKYIEINNLIYQNNINNVIEIYKSGEVIKHNILFI